jgi:hypothetical protein
MGGSENLHSLNKECPEIEDINLTFETQAIWKLLDPQAQK